MEMEVCDPRRGPGSSRDDAGAAQPEAAQSYGCAARNSGEGAAEATTEPTPGGSAWRRQRMSSDWNSAMAELGVAPWVSKAAGSSVF